MVEEEKQESSEHDPIVEMNHHFMEWFDNEFQSSKRFWKNVRDKCIEFGFDDSKFLMQMVHAKPHVFRNDVCRNFLGIDKDAHFKRFVKGIQVCDARIDL